MIDGLTNSDSIPTLERALQFAGARHRLIANNIANISTPNYRPMDVSVTAFQQQIGEAIDRQRMEHGAFQIEDSREVRIDDDGMTLRPQPLGENILFHDGNDRNLERTMQDLVENFMTFRYASQMLKNRFELLNTAIRERV
jgi:flagellar basal-body rod protein FlgB